MPRDPEDLRPAKRVTRVPCVHPSPWRHRDYQPSVRLDPTRCTQQPGRALRELFGHHCLRRCSYDATSGPTLDRRGSHKPTAPNFSAYPTVKKTAEPLAARPGKDWTGEQIDPEQRRSTQSIAGLCRDPPKAGERGRWTGNRGRCADAGHSPGRARTSNAVRPTRDRVADPHVYTGRDCSCTRDLWEDLCHSPRPPARPPPRHHSSPRGDRPGERYQNPPETRTPGEQDASTKTPRRRSTQHDRPTSRARAMTDRLARAGRAPLQSD